MLCAALLDICADAGVERAFCTAHDVDGPGFLCLWHRVAFELFRECGEFFSPSIAFQPKSKSALDKIPKEYVLFLH